MIRLAEQNLSSWLKKSSRKPLVIRGARQVGKSTLVRNFAKQASLDLVEINLEKHPLLNDIFGSNDTSKILAELESLTNKKIVPGRSLLLLDEIQATPLALAALRYFFEDVPQLAVIATGSLLEFVLAKHHFSMPVGRIEYLHLGPLNFREFLMALGEEQLINSMNSFLPSGDLPSMAHNRLLKRHREYIFVGGMPEAVFQYSQTKSLQDARDVHKSVIQTYQDDFAKYATFAQLNQLHRVFNAFPQWVGKKVKYTNFSKEDRGPEIKNAIDLLTKARLFLPVYHSDCSGVPLKAQINDRVYKLYFLDVGLLNYLCGLDWSYLARMTDAALINEGVIAEQFVAQHLAYRFDGNEPPDLFYWLRETQTTNAELDFVVSFEDKIIPVEVKAGKSGSLKSLLQFVAAKHPSQTIRFDLNMPSTQQVSHKIAQGDTVAAVQFTLNSFPLYFAGDMMKILPTLA